MNTWSRLSTIADHLPRFLERQPHVSYQIVHQGAAHVSTIMEGKGNGRVIRRLHAAVGALLRHHCIDQLPLQQSPESPRLSWTGNRERLGSRRTAVLPLL